MELTWFKIKGRDTKITCAEFPGGYILEFHLGATSRDQALVMCKEKGVNDIEYCEEESGWEPGMQRD